MMKYEDLIELCLDKAAAKYEQAQDMIERLEAENEALRKDNHFSEDSRILGEHEIHNAIDEYSCWNCGETLREYPTTDPDYVRSFVCDACGHRFKWFQDEMESVQ